ncbi:unnamed protein product [Cylicostephanus goldi]|uniref:Uncharacterized protein n=1 Tax=Cylicostephanus goldi TaxID=71465 RepID=A0A3P7MIH5_CYLGO|nr:unnamed protein product [Cylicostephanus goldi]
MFTVLLARYYQRCFEGSGQEGRKELSLEEEFGLMDNPDEAQIDPEVRARFQSASAYLPSIVGRLERSHLIQFYALYKQATVGPASERYLFFFVRFFIAFILFALPSYVAKMAYMNLGWDPTVQNTSHGGFGVRPSRPAFVSESSDGSAASVSDREALLWFTAAKADDVTTITDIYSRRPELLNQTDQHLGMTALHWAIDSGCDKVVQFLISKDTDVNAVDPEGNTPLHFAAYCHRQSAAEVLISKGADRTIRNNDGQTAAEVCDDETLKAILMPPE